MYAHYYHHKWVITCALFQNINSCHGMYMYHILNMIKHHLLEHVDKAQAIRT